MKRLLALIMVFLLLPVAGCTSDSPDTDKIQIVATLFPQYDFARQIGGDKVDVTILLPAGSESHHYDPSPSDMVLISDSDLFIYTGDSMEGWAGEIAASITGDTVVLDASQNVTFAASAHDEHENEHEHSVDPHIWLDFDNAKTMAKSIADALIDISPENSDYFTQNLDAFVQSIDSLDAKYQELFASYPDKTLIFGGKFALGYLTRRYNVSYKSAYDSCSANSEPSPSDIVLLSDYVKANDIKVVYCEEFSDPKVAREIAAANNAEVLVLHSAHNTSLEERNSNTTFISIMEQNLENIRKGLE